MRAIAATVIRPVANQPSTLTNSEFVLSPMMLLLFEMSIMMISKGGARTPFNTAVQKSILIGFSLKKLRHIPSSEAIAITA